VEQFVVEVAKEVPSLAVLAFIVWTFIGHIKGAATELRETHTRCHEIQGKTAAAMDRFGDKVDRLVDAVEDRCTNGGVR
jgi:hypothetical protein